MPPADAADADVEVDADEDAEADEEKEDGTDDKRAGASVTSIATSGYGLACFGALKPGGNRGAV